MLNPYLFVYGTLKRDAANSRHAEYLSQARFMTHGVFQGRLFRIKNYPAVIASDVASDKVYGEIYKLDQPKQRFILLDQYEECSADFPQPTEYIRCECPIKWADGQSRLTWVYLYNRDTAHLTRLESGRF